LGPIAPPRADRLRDELRPHHAAGRPRGGRLPPRARPPMRGLTLSLVVFLPALGGLLIAIMPRGREGIVKQAALAVALVTFAVSLPLYFGFDAGVADYQFQERRPWMPSLGISYHLGID